ncbi:MAG: DUF3500 domain-containing protein [Planctomyces sp.]|nr:DUF3500 domain-containing protein [Planctomyces sp.]
MRLTRPAVVVACVFALGATANTFFEEVNPAVQLTESAAAFIETLDDAQKQAAVLPYDTPRRTDWHFIPKPERKGLEVKHMSAEQRDAAFRTLQAALSQIGYRKATGIMALESLLHELEGGRGSNIRDPQRYFFTFFGTVGEGRWGLSVEGHHLSLNFVIDGDQVISSSPQALATNPAIVKAENASGVAVGTRILDKEETLAFELVNSLTAQQRARAVFREEALSEVRNAGEPQPPKAAPEGIAASELNDDQKKLLEQLLVVYCESMPEKVAAQRLSEIREAGWDQVHFGWAGATQPGIGHYYRVQGPTFLVEFVNTQPDAAGNIANHIHSLWRDMRGDFALPIDAE